MGISVGGLASGIDSDSIISQLLALEEQRIFLIQKRIAEEEVKKASYQDLSSRVSSLKSVASSLKNPDVFGKLEASSTDAGLSVTAKKTAAEGNYKVEVQQIATKHRVAAQGFKDDSTTAVAALGGTFSYQIGSGTEKTIELEATTTLKELAEKINESSGITASIVNDGSDQNPYRLILTAKTPGQDNEIVINQNPTTLNFSDKQIEAVTIDEDNAAEYLGTVTSGGTYTGEENTSYVMEVITEGAADGSAKYRLSTDGGLTFDDNGGVGFSVTSGGPLALANGVTINFEDNGSLKVGDTFSVDVFNPELEKPQDAILKVDGISIRKSTNVINDVFEGITFNVENATLDKSTTLSVKRDSGTVTEKLSEFIGAYNGVVGFLSAQFSYDPAGNTSAPPLNGDSAARQVDREVKKLIATRMEGLAGDTVSTLTELGITSNKESGLLSFTPATLESVIKDDPRAAERVLGSFGERLSGNFEYVARSSKTKPGEYNVTVTQARSKATLVGTAAAETLVQDEVLSVSFNRDATNEDAAVRTLDINLTAGQTKSQQLETINEALENRGFELEATLDDNDNLVVEATEYGDDYAIDIVSDIAAGAGSSGIGNVLIADEGKDLEGLIDGTKATIFGGNQLKGASGFDGEGIRVEVPDGITGSLGSVRIVNGLAAVLPGIVDRLTGSNGVIGTRTSGVDKRIESLQADIIKQQDRISNQEERLRRQFTAMEVTMAQLNSLGDYITQQMEAMANANKK
jgi:flagellar capping protein FliD